MPTSKRTVLKQLGAAGTGLALAGCLGDESDSADGGSEDEPITVGASMALTGALAQEGTWQERGYELWAKSINEHGGLIEPNDEPGLLGREVELVVYDDESDPQRALDLYQRLISEDDVDILMGPYGSSISGAVLPRLEQEGMVCVMPFASGVTVFRERDLDYAFQAVAPGETYLAGAVDIAVENGAETAALLYENTAFPVNVAEGTIEYMEEQGLEVIHDEPYPADIDDYTALMSQIADDDIDVVLGGSFTPDAIGLTRSAESLDLQPGIFSWMVGGTLPAFEEAVGASVRGMTGDLFFDPNVDGNYTQEMVELAVEEYDDVEEGWDIQSHLAGGFSAGLLFEKAIKTVGSLDQDEIAAELRSIDTRESDFGLPFGNGEYAVDDRGLQIAHRPSLGQWQEQDDGSMGMETVWPEEIRTAEPIYPHPGW